MKEFYGGFGCSSLVAVSSGFKVMRSVEGKGKKPIGENETPLGFETTMVGPATNEGGYDG